MNYWLKQRQQTLAHAMAHQLRCHLQAKAEYYLNQLVEQQSNIMKSSTKSLSLKRRNPNASSQA